MAARKTSALEIIGGFTLAVLIFLGVLVIGAIGLFAVLGAYNVGKACARCSATSAPTGYDALPPSTLPAAPKVNFTPPPPAQPIVRLEAIRQSKRADADGIREFGTKLCCSTLKE